MPFFQLNQNTELRSVLVLLGSRKTLLSVDVCEGHCPQTTECIAYKVTVLPGDPVFHSSPMQALSKMCSLNSLPHLVTKTLRVRPRLPHFCQLAAASAVTALPQRHGCHPHTAFETRAAPTLGPEESE